jgi:hypothetical protein
VKRWTEDEVEHLKRMWLAPGHTASAIAREMHRSRESIIRKARYLDLPKRVVEADAVRKHKDAVREIVREGYDKGRTACEIVKNLSDAGHKMTKNAVIGLANRMGLKNKRGQKFLPYGEPQPKNTEAHTRMCQWVKQIDPGHPPSVEYCHRKAGVDGVWCDQHREIVYVKQEEMPKWLRKLASG